MNKGDIVVVIETGSLPVSFLGHYGKVTKLGERKLTVEFAQRVGRSGSLSHTVYESELIVVGKAFE